MSRRACLTGFVIIGGVTQPVTAEFWDMRYSVCLVAIPIEPTGRTYQHYFAEDYFVDAVEDAQCMFSDELPREVEVILRWGDRNPMKVW